MNPADASRWRRLYHTPLGDVLRGRWTASLDWRGIVTGAGLPEETANLVDRVVHRTRLWRSEKADVARELVAHFEDGLEAGRTPQELTESFGDAQQAARLIRRAKHRGRPLIWHLWHYGWLTVLLTIVIYAMLAVWYLMRRPAPNTDYLSRLNTDVHNVAPDERAWPLYREALTELEFRPSDGPGPHVLPGNERWPELERFLTDHADGLVKLREAAARPYLGYEVGFQTQPEDYAVLGEFHPEEELPGEAHPSLLAVLLQHVPALRRGARLLEADAYRTIDADDPLAAYQDVVALLGMSRQLGQSPFLVSGLVALFFERQAGSVIEYALTTRPQLWSDEQLTELAHRLGGRQFNHPAWVESERIAMHDTIQRLYSDNGHGDGRITYTGLRLLVKWMRDKGGPGFNSQAEATANGLLAVGMPLVVGLMASRAELEEEVDKLFALAVADMQRPLWDEQSHMMKDELQRLRKSKWSQVEYLPILVLVPIVDSVRLAVESTNGRAEGVMIGLALELYHRENGRWPNALDELAPRWLPAVPIDRINGGPLGYRIVDDRPLVYSLGNDTDDDGGRLPESLLTQDDAERPVHYRVEGPAPNAEDGDWVIWSTARQDVRGE